MVVDVMYGTEDGIKYYVQTCCDEEHDGKDCDCKSYGEDLTEEEALAKAVELSKKYGVEIMKC